MKLLVLFVVAMGSFLLVPAGRADQGCRYFKSRGGLSGFEDGGIYILDHSRLTRGRADLREFLWQHWSGHRKGIAEARIRTAGRGTVRALYVVQSDPQGRWGINVEIDRPMEPPCTGFFADALVRVPIANPGDDYLQTAGLWPLDKLPPNLLADSGVVDSKLYRLMLVRNSKPLFSDLI